MPWVPTFGDLAFAQEGALKLDLTPLRGLPLRLVRHAGYGNVNSRNPKHITPEHNCTYNHKLIVYRNVNVCVWKNKYRCVQRSAILAHVRLLVRVPSPPSPR